MSDGHQHSHGEGGSAQRLGIALLLAATYMAAEVAGGLYTGSLALLADAGHMLSDVAALALALVAMAMVKRPSTDRHTFGNYRAEVLAALLNAVALIVIALVICKEAIERWSDPPEVNAGPMLAIAFGGLVVNVVALLILSGGQKDNLNVRGAFLHVVADALGSVGAMISGGLIWAFGWNWADPMASLIIAVLIIFSGAHLLRQTLQVLMQAAPVGLEIEKVKTAMEEVHDVKGIHDIHAWTLASGKDLFSAHVVLAADAPWPSTLAALHQLLRDEFSLSHVTLQPELQSEKPCRCAFEDISPKPTDSTP